MTYPPTPIFLAAVGATAFATAPSTSANSNTRPYARLQTLHSALRGEPNSCDNRLTISLYLVNKDPVNDLSQYIHQVS